MKQIGYHVDRSKSLSTGDCLNLSRPDFFSFSPVFPLMWNEGISKHGMNYLRKTDSFNSAIIEMNLELVRLSLFKDCFPSRMQSFFIVPSVESLSSWKNELYGDFPVFEIGYETDSCYCFDASNLLGGIDRDNTINQVLNLLMSFQYWASISNPHKSKPEILIPYPVTIGKCVGLSNALIDSCPQ